MLIVPRPHLLGSFIFFSEEKQHDFSFLPNIRNTKIVLKLLESPKTFYVSH